MNTAGEAISHQIIHETRGTLFEVSACVKPTALCFWSHPISGPIVSKKQNQLGIFLWENPFCYVLLFLSACQQIIPLCIYYICNKLYIYIIFWVVLKKFSKPGPYYDFLCVNSDRVYVGQRMKAEILSGLRIWAPAQSVLNIMGTILHLYTIVLSMSKEISVINSWASGLHRLRTFRKFQKSPHLLRHRSRGCGNSLMLVGQG